MKYSVLGTKRIEMDHNHSLAAGNILYHLNVKEFLFSAEERPENFQVSWENLLFDWDGF